MPEHPGPRHRRNTIRQDVERSDAWLEYISPLLPVVAGAGAVWLAPSVDVENGTLGVFLSTLALSLGCALGVWVMRGTDLAGWPLGSALALCFLVSMYAAAMAGTGTMDPDAVMANAPGGNPLSYLVGVLITAVETFGVVGAVLGAASGIWLGHVAAKHVEHHVG